MVVLGVEASVSVACGTWRCASASHVVAARAVFAACLALSSLSGCSFEQSPLVSGKHRQSVAPPSSSDGSGGSTGEPADPGPQPLTGSSDASAAPGSSSPDAGGGAGKPGPTVAPKDGGEDSVVDHEPDSGTDTGAPDPDPDPDPDPRDSGCNETPACVCAHDRLETPDDACAARDCPIDECAPDRDCVLKRFESSVYYLCSNPRAQSAADERCQTIDGMHLVYIGDGDEDDFLDDVVDGKVWIGAELSEGVWSWFDDTAFYDEDDGEPVDDAYVDWDQDSDEPNGVGVGAGSVTCAILWSETGAWADTNCTAQNGYVCEKEF